ncbi:MAG TPA: FtsQ-type POTRA domain-containing protein [Actinomycetales bacterium]|nr:FtsQ-type POTRA domain-containing protein [Actinomycetales bacterium]
MSGTSVRRFAARARTARWVALRPLLAATSVAGAVALLAWVVLATPLLAVRSVEVVGTERVPSAEVAALADEDLGTPLARVDTGALADRVEDLAMVRSAEVVRAWPSTLEVRVVERVPLAAVPSPGGIDILDAEGVVLATVPEPPPDLPLVEVDVPSAGADALRETTTVLQALPDDLRAQVERAGAASPDSVTLVLRGGAQVVWGSADDAAMKAEVLRVLLSQPADVYDVSSPTTPVTR